METDDSLSINKKNLFLRRVNEDSVVVRIQENPVEKLNIGMETPPLNVREMKRLRRFLTRQIRTIKLLKEQQVKAPTAPVPEPEPPKDPATQRWMETLLKIKKEKELEDE